MRFLWFLGLSALLFAQQQPAARPARPDSPAEVRPEDKCTLEGQVFSLVTGEPLKKATVTLRSTSAQEAFTTQTDAAGRYAMKDLEPGTYSFSAQRQGYVEQIYSAKKPGGPGMLLTLARAQHLSKLDFKLSPHAVLTGKVVDADGEAIAGASVRLLHFVYVEGKKQLLPYGYANTNDLGEYRIWGVAPGKYFLSVMPPQEPNSGRTADRSAQPDPPPGIITTYFPSAADPRSAVPVEVPAGGQLRGMDVTLLAARTYRVKGRVFGLSSGQQAVLLLMPRDSSSNYGSSPVVQPTSGKENSFEFRGLTQGSYSIAAIEQGGPNSRSANVELEVGRENVEGLSITLGTPVSLSGVFKKEGDGDLNFPDLHIFLTPENPGSRFARAYSQVTKEDGTFTVLNVSAEKMRCQVIGLKGNAYVKAVRLGERDLLDVAADLSSGAGQELQVLISTNGGEIDGIVKDKEGNPRKGAPVFLIPEDGLPAAQPLRKSSSTDQYGAFKFQGIRPSAYQVIAFEEVEAGPQWEPGYLKPVSKYSR